MIPAANKLPNQSIGELITASHTIGEQLELIQGGGGNTSIKADGVMYIKASGTPLKGMSETKGWVALDDTGKVVGEDTGVKPSMEWPMHLLLPRVVMHAHAVYANVWLCQVGGLERLASKLAYYQPILIPYITPGHELAAVIKQQIAGKQPQLLLLENHGVIVCGEQVDEVVQILNTINGSLKAELPAFTIEANPPILPSVFPDAAVFTGTTAMTDGVREILSANHYLHATITAMSGTVQPLPANEGDKLRAMETEQYRMQQV